MPRRPKLPKNKDLSDEFHIQLLRQQAEHVRPIVPRLGCKSANTAASGSGGRWCNDSAADALLDVTYLLRPQPPGRSEARASFASGVYCQKIFPRSSAGLALSLTSIARSMPYVLQKVRARPAHTKTTYFRRPLACSTFCILGTVWPR